ncbi:autophagy-related protein 27 [Moniliophthora roreri MCA 2997]|uniref:Autophagy-related protein 27 n=1 Tax=Moniliophthora roreri (strain MCA 2997) TaxID=1381753 RepID=V2XTG2_MONRO|nr:autophagy-related protein 27 [Moniliophthora roreri MCA 2997]
MLSRHYPSPVLLYLLIFYSTSSVLAQQEHAFDCHVTIDTSKWDLTPLAGEHTITRIREMPPSKMEDTVLFNLCDDLKSDDKVPERDQCPPGTRCCLTKTNKKESEQDRITAVVPIAQTSSLNVSSSILSSPKGLSLVLHGDSYPNPVSGESTPQSLRLDLLCGEPTDPLYKFLSYDGSQLHLEWTNPAGCSTQNDGDGSKGGEGGNDGNSGQSVGSGLGFFFGVLLLALFAYFGLGAYYNYTTYGASGMDLIPHRDFWREVPYMLKDVISHLCSTVSPRRTSSRGGYISV